MVTANLFRLRNYSIPRPAKLDIEQKNVKTNPAPKLQQQAAQQPKLQWQTDYFKTCPNHTSIP
jgi:hypothetical protein